MENTNVTPLVPKEKTAKEENSLVSSLSPREIVSELDRFVVGQNKAKKAVAVALRNRWRRQALKGEMKNEVLPKNILMIGPTGVGKTEISRRLSKLAEAPFVKVEATRFTEVGYVGRDVEQIVRDLVEIAISMEKVKMRKEVHAQAQKLAEEKVLDALVGKKASLATRESFRKRLRNGDLDDNEIEIAVSDSGSNNTSFEIPGMPGANVGMINIGEMIGKSMGNKEKKKKMSVKESHDILINDESDKLIEQDKIIKAAKISTENNGIVFLDEIDKISARTDRAGGDVSREGVQRDLLPLIEGTTVNTKHGPIKTDHILFIASGAFQLAKPSDLLPELQGRLPIRVELEALTSDDFKRILREPDFSLIKQYVALLKTENVATFSVFKRATYCLIKLKSGSLKILLKSSLVNASSSTLMGSLPCNSGSKSEGFASWNAPDAMNKIWSVLIGPCFVLTVVPSIKGSKSLCTPSRETSPPALSVLAEILSISSKKTIPLFSVDIFAALIILSCSINLSDSSLIKMSWDSFTDIFFFFSLFPIDLPIISPMLIMPTFAPGIPGISKEVLFDPLSLTAISISLSSKSPLRSLFLKLSLVAKLAFLPTSASKTFSSANFWAWAWTSFLIFTFSIEIAISTKSRTICSTSLPT